jgi:hypothetical protein
VRGTTKPLGQRKEARADAGEFHDAVLRAHGKLCFFNREMRLKTAPGAKTTRARRPEERCEGKSASVVHAMHVIPRSQLGPKTRYALPEKNGRPGCPTCHALQEEDLLEFPDAVHDAAVRALADFSPKIANDLLRLLRSRRG